MDTKGTEEEIVYPNIFFTVDNFEEVHTQSFFGLPDLLKDRSSFKICLRFIGTFRLSVNGRF